MIEVSAASRIHAERRNPSSLTDFCRRCSKEAYSFACNVRTDVGLVAVQRPRHRCGYLTCFGNSAKLSLGSLPKIRRQGARSRTVSLQSLTLAFRRAGTDDKKCKDICLQPTETTMLRNRKPKSRKVGSTSARLASHDQSRSSTLQCCVRKFRSTVPAVPEFINTVNTSSDSGKRSNNGIQLKDNWPGTDGKTSLPDLTATIAKPSASGREDEGCPLVI